MKLFAETDLHMSSKLKKKLKKSLIQIYTQVKNSYFVLESSLQKNSSIRTCYASHLIGSNALQVGLSGNLQSKLPLKLPTLVKTYFEELHELSLKNSNLGLSSFVLIKKKNLFMKNETYKFICVDNLFSLTKVKTTFFVCMIKLKLSAFSVGPF